MEDKVADVTVSSVDPLMAPAVAVIVVWPAPTAVATPSELMLATEEAEEPQLTELVRSCMLPSLKVPVAVIGCVAPIAIDVFCGFTWMETRLGVTFRVVNPL
jgi:hypothetical protein